MWYISATLLLYNLSFEVLERKLKVAPDDVFRDNKMKRLMVFVLSTLFFGLLFVQCKSKEDKANELIKDYMFKNLYDFESYQPIETTIDSAFHTIYNDSTALYYAYSILFSEEEQNDL